MMMVINIKVFFRELSVGLPPSISVVLSDRSALNNSGDSLYPRPPIFTYCIKKFFGMLNHSCHKLLFLLRVGN